MREMIKRGIAEGFISPKNEGLIIFVDGPSDESAHVDYDWGADVLRVLDEWQPNGWTGFGFDWSRTADGHKSTGGLEAV